MLQHGCQQTSWWQLPCPQSQHNLEGRSQPGFAHATLMSRSLDAAVFRGRLPVRGPGRLASPVRQARRRLICRALEGESNLVSDEQTLTEAMQNNRVLVVDWMAKWCRKCIYLKPKLEKMMREEFPNVPLLCIDVNAVPGALVYGHGVKKMPTIQTYVDGKLVAEHIAKEGGPLAIQMIREMLKLNLMDVRIDDKPVVTI